MLETDAPRSVEAVLRKQKGRYILHMVNLTGEMIRPTTQILPLYDIKVTLRAKGIKSVKTLRGTKLKNLEIGENKATFTMSKLTDYEVAVFTLKK